MYQTSVVMVLVVYEIRLRKRLSEKTLPATAISVRLRGGVRYILTTYYICQYLSGTSERYAMVVCLMHLRCTVNDDRNAQRMPRLLVTLD